MVPTFWASLHPHASHAVFWNDSTGHPQPQESRGLGGRGPGSRRNRGDHLSFPSIARGCTSYVGCAVRRNGRAVRGPPRTPDHRSGLVRRHRGACLTSASASLLETDSRPLNIPTSCPTSRGAVAGPAVQVQALLVNHLGRSFSLSQPRCPRL